LSVVCIKVVVERKGRYEGTEGSGVHDEMQRTNNSPEEHHRKRNTRKIDGCHI